MASRKIAEERSVGEHLSRNFISDHLCTVSSTISSSLHLLRVLNEVQDDLSRHGASSYGACLRARPDATAPARLSSVTAVASAVADARVALANACYGELDVAVNALDRRLKLTEAVLKLHGQGLGGVDDITGAEEKLAVLTRPKDAISTRVGRRATAAEEGGGGGGGGGSSSASSSAAGALKSQLAAATGCGVGGAASSPGALDLAIGSHEPLYCLCRQVAFGDMIACDSETCAVEWFHYGCVGVSTTKRPTSWLCPECRGTGEGFASAAASAAPPPPKKRK
jgi:hypothetical protein